MMKNVRAWALLMALVLISIVVPPRVAAAENNVDVDNQSDGWVWVTVRASVKKVIGTRIENIAWYCVNPHSSSHKSDFSERPIEALFEMTREKACAHPLTNTSGKNADSNGNIRATMINNPNCRYGYPCPAPFVIR
jgi:hypothetical protein